MLSGSGDFVLMTNDLHEYAATLNNTDAVINATISPNIRVFESKQRLNHHVPLYNDQYF
jgi:hypothetical protein